MALPEIDAILDDLIQPDGPGAAVAVIQNGAVLHKAGYGLANVEWGIPIEANTVFRLASITKQFTATAIMMLAEQRQLKLDDPITVYLPDYHMAGHVVTIRHLLNHTSGIFSYTNVPNIFETVHLDKTPQQMADEFSTIPFEFKPGTKMNYNNSGYVLLGMIIEQISGMDYGMFITENIFKPLNMNQSCLLDNKAIIPKRCVGYHKTDDGFQHAPYLSMTQPYAAGSLGSTIDDLILWDAALCNNSIISAESLMQMTTPTTLENGEIETYGFGWGLGSYEGQNMMAHGGGIPGFSTYIARFESLTVILLSNFVGAMDVRQVTVKLARTVLGLSPVKHKPFIPSAGTLGKCLGDYESDGILVSVVQGDDGRVLLTTMMDETWLVPFSRTEFYNADFPEDVFTFGAEVDNLYTTLTFTGPLSGKMVYKRVQD